MTTSQGLEIQVTTVANVLYIASNSILPISVVEPESDQPPKDLQKIKSEFK
jgi:hypothetical protein